MKSTVLKAFICILFFLNHQFSYSSTDKSKLNDSIWVDSVFKTMTIDEKIGQLFMIRILSNKDKVYYDEIYNTIKDYNVGGICFFQGSPVKEALITNEIQSQVKIPLFVAIDGEWGLAMRLDSTISYPRQMMLGAIKNDSLIYEMGKSIANQCKRIGININFAPVIDINNNPANPVINIRSFGQDKYNVTRKGIMYMNGLQNNGVLASAKHFPGHGDTDTDSHLTLPVINHSFETIDSLDLYPFRQLFKKNVGSVMVAHLFIPSLDPTKNTPSTLSPKIVNDLLKQKLNFKGLVFTDALDMKGVSNYKKPGVIETKALIAGVDVLLLPQDIKLAIKEIRRATDSCWIYPEDIDEKCKKILFYKYKLGLSNIKPIKIDSIYNDLNSPSDILLQRKLVENSITLIRNQNNIIPLKCLDTLKLACLSIGDTTFNAFQEIISNYAKVDNFNIGKNVKQNSIDSLVKLLEPYNLVIIGIQNTSVLFTKNFGLSPETFDIIDSIRAKHKIILNIFASPYVLNRLRDLKNVEALVVSYQSTPLIENLSAQAIFGSINYNAKIPVTGSADFPLYSGLSTKLLKRFKYTLPEEININSNDLSLIDSIAIKGIKNKAYPGCQILVAKDGKVIYKKSFGYFTYDSIRPVKNTDLYDIASVTKIAATTLSIMKLYDQKKINIDKQLIKYLPFLKMTNKEHIKIRNLMAHQAGLKSWIPFYEKTLINGKLDTNIYSKTQSSLYPLKVADSIFIKKEYTDSIFKFIAQSPLNKNNKYLYSDMGFYLLMKIIENISKQTFENYLNSTFYKPLGLSTMSFNPAEKFKISKIVPTEFDSTFRKQLIQGYVHDPGAAMMGGISGHAGLFSNSNDLAVIMQMLIQNGEYGDKKFISNATIKEFSRCQFPENKNRRGLGFDKPSIIENENGPTSKKASLNSFGHTGFTGTYAWADPDENLVFIFLSNRVYPDFHNSKLAEMNIRTDIQEVIYNAMEKSKLRIGK